MAGITSHFGDPIKQYPGEGQVLWRVRVQAPGKHFNGLRGAEVSAKYWVSAVEYRERYSFERHQKGWGAAHTGPRHICLRRRSRRAMSYSLASSRPTLQLEVLLPAPVGGGHRQALQRKVLFKVVAGPGPSPSLSLSLSDHVKLSRKTVLSHLTVISHCHVGQLISPVFTVTG